MSTSSSCLVCTIVFFVVGGNILTGCDSSDSDGGSPFGPWIEIPEQVDEYRKILKITREKILLWEKVGSGQYACYELAVTDEVVEWDGSTLRLESGAELPSKLTPDVSGDRMRLDEERYRRVQSVQSAADEEFCDF